MSLTRDTVYSLVPLLTLESLHIILLLSLPRIRAFSAVLLLHTTSRCISSQVSLQDGSRLSCSSFYARVSSVSQGHSIHGSPLSPYFGILIRPGFPAVPAPVTDTAPALPCYSHNTGLDLPRPESLPLLSRILSTFRSCYIQWN